MMKQINYLEYAEYNEIICRLIYEFNISSQIKVIFIAFSIKNEMYDLKKHTNQKYGTLDIILNGIKLGFGQGMSDFTIIFDCLSLLRQGGFISLQDGRIERVKSVTYSREIDCLNHQAMRRAINEAEKLSDDSIIRGVIEYV